MPLEGPALGFAYAVFKDASKFTSKYITANDQFMADALAKHLVRADAWSSTINMLGMSKPADVDNKSIAVAISSEPRKFYSQRSPESLIEESNILESRSSMMILGDPGSGKTTIVKRLVRHLIHDVKDESGAGYMFPVIIFGRDVSDSSSLFDQIFRAIGFSVVSAQSPGIDRQEFEEWHKDWSAHIKSAISTALLNAPVIVFIDGIDEVSPVLRASFERDTEYLNDTMSLGKVVATCRSGDWNRSLSNFEVYEIGPLSEDQIVEISEMWANDPAAFQGAITRVPYRDILDRPLLLTLLIIIFNQTGGVPDQPVDVYQKFVSLLISEWDEQRDVKRHSRFADFQAGRKFRFLCDASYQLMKVGATRFTGKDLERALQETALRFGQTESEIQVIVRELESHTGILVESGFGNYEFCHLTVQEYLAANYLVGLPSRGRELRTTVGASPATLAVAVSLSSEPTEFLAETILDLIGPEGVNFRNPMQSRFLTSFLARLRLERPTLMPSTKLGIVVMLILYAFDTGWVMRHSLTEYQTMWGEIEAFVDHPAARRSLALVETLFDVRASPHEKTYLGDGVLLMLRPDDERAYLPGRLELSLSSLVLSYLAKLGAAEWLTSRVQN